MHCGDLTVGIKASAKNVELFGDRISIATRSDDDIKHLARVVNATNFVTFETLIDHRLPTTSGLKIAKELKKLKN